MKYDRTKGSKRSQGIITPKAPQNRPRKKIRVSLPPRETPPVEFKEKAIDKVKSFFGFKKQLSKTFQMRKV